MWLVLKSLPASFAFSSLADFCFPIRQGAIVLVRSWDELLCCGRFSGLFFFLFLLLPAQIKTIVVAAGH